MTTLGRPIFGISVIPNAADYHALVAQVLAAERGGLDVVGIQDHPYQRRFLDTYALVAALMAQTTRLRFFPDVTSLPMRPPAMIAKAAASLDVMSGGRFELGLGAGAFWDAVVGMGGPRREGREIATGLEEAIHIIRAALDVGPEKRVVRGPGPHYPIPGYPPGPPPAHRVEIWIGAMAPRAMEIIGRLADGWIPGSGVQQVGEFPRLNERIIEAARAAGRDPRAIRRIVNMSGRLTDQRGEGPLEGPAEQWIEAMTGWALDLGIDGFVLWPPDMGTDQVERFASEVVPAVHDAVARERNA